MRSLLARNIRWVVTVGAVLVFMATIPMASEAHGRRWSGMDPELIVNGQKVNVIVEWHNGHACDIRGPIRMKISVPHGADYRFNGESSERFDCDGDGKADKVLMTKTRVMEGRDSHFSVNTKVSAPGYSRGRGNSFGTGIEIWVNDELDTECRAMANKRIKCQGPEL